jgi:Na+/proline symporter
MHITHVGAIALWILAFFIPLQLYIGYRLVAKSGQSAAHYFISGKQLPVMILFFLNFATAMGMGNFMAYAGRGYQIGLNQLWMVLGEQGTKLLFALLLAGFIGKFSYTTINEFMDKEFFFHSKWLRAAGGILMCVPLVALTGLQAIGIGTILNVCMGVDVTTGIWVAALTVILYTVMGGMWAIAWTDLVQGTIRIIVGFIFYATIVYLMHGVGGIRAATLATKPELWSVKSIGGWAALSIFLSPMTGQFTAQHWWQRCFAAKDPKTSRNAFLGSGIFCVVMCTCSVLVGIAGHAVNPNLAKPDLVFPWLLNTYLHPVVGALLVVTLIGAGMTTSAGFLNSGVTMLTMDIVRPLFRKNATDKELVGWAQWLTFVLGVGVIWVAMHFPTMVAAALFGYTAVGGGLFVPLVVGLCWKDSNGRTYVSKHAAMASLLFGGGTAIVFELAPRLHKIFGGGIIPGVGVSLVLTMLISLLGLTSRKQTAKSVGV